MCGICGIAYNELNKKVSEHLLKTMCDSMRHRGPDESGYYSKSNVGLGMRRLRVIDLETGSQPILSDDGKKAIVFNGEIYNFLELTKELEKKGHEFRTRSDTEVILKLYEEYGFDCLQYLNGMFGIAIWDGEKKQLLLARDRLGEKPLHYVVSREGIMFSSEIKSILSSNMIDREIDYKAIYYYFMMLCIPAPLTIYKHIRKLLPGHYLVYKDGKARIKKYWDVKFEPDESKTEWDFCQELKELMRNSVKNRMISDVPLGAFLSGGIDSSIIVAQMSMISERPIKTFSIGFKEDKFNELKFARMIADRYKTDHHEFIVEAKMSVDLAEKLVWYFDEPFGGPSAIPTFLVSELAKQFVTVVITGDGGDETFAGYDSYLAALKRRRLRAVPMRLRDFIARKIGDRLPNSAYGKRFLQSLSMDEVSCFMGLTNENWKRNVFSQEFLLSIGDPSVQDVYSKYVNNESKDLLSQLQYLDTKCYLPDNVLVKVDRMSMANSLETRTVFLDHNLVEFSARVPASYKIRRNKTKYLLKKCFRDSIPTEILNRGKWGFALPVGPWFRGELKELITSIVSNKDDPELFNYPYLETVVSEHMTGRRDHNKFLWSLMMFGLWKRIVRSQ